MASFIFNFSAPLHFQRTLAYIGRFENDRMEAVAEGRYYHVLGDEAGHFLLEVAETQPQQLAVRLCKGRGSVRREKQIRRFVERTFGDDDTLLAFYRFARKDKLLSQLVRRFQGVRLVGMSSLWECLSWSIIGQQVSVQSAFSTRSRITAKAGAAVEWNGDRYEGFPSVQQISALTLNDLRACGCSRQKADYLKALAEEILSGELDEAELMQLPFDHVRKRLLALRGIGPWSVEYAMLRCLGDPDACPYEDIGLRNAVGKECGLGRQASMEEVKDITAAWKPFRGFGTFYIWQTLLKPRGKTK